MRRRALDPDLTFGDVGATGGGASSKGAASSRPPRQPKGNNTSTAAANGQGQPDRGTTTEQAPKRFKPLQLDHGSSTTSFGRRIAVAPPPAGLVAAADRPLGSALDRGSWVESLASSLSKEEKRREQPASRRKVDDVRKRTRYGSEVRKEERRARAALRNDGALRSGSRSASISGQSSRAREKARASPVRQREEENEDLEEGPPRGASSDGVNDARAPGITTPAPAERSEGATTVPDMSPSQCQIDPDPKPVSPIPNPDHSPLPAPPTHVGPQTPVTPHPPPLRQGRLLALDTPLENRAGVAPPHLSGSVEACDESLSELAPTPHRRAALTIYKAKACAGPSQAPPPTADEDDALLHLARNLWPDRARDQRSTPGSRVVRPIIFRGAAQIKTYFAPYTRPLTYSRRPPSYGVASAWAEERPGGASGKHELWETSWEAEEEWTESSQEDKSSIETRAAAADSSSM